MFNVLDTRDGGKVDFWMLTEDPFDRSRFARRVEATYQGTALWVSSPEDTILAKLRWARLSGGREKQYGDALRVYEVQRAVLDLDYLGQWADRLEVRDLYDRVLREAVDAEG